MSEKENAFYFQYTVPEGMDYTSIRYGIDTAIRCVQKLPVKPIRCGYWVPKNMKRGKYASIRTIFECSECKKTNGRSQSNYCKHCGAFMIKVKMRRDGAK